MEVFELEHDFSFSAVNVCEGDERPCSELQVGFVCFQTVSFLVIEAFDLGKCTFFCLAERSFHFDPHLNSVCDVSLPSRAPFLFKSRPFLLHLLCSLC